MASYYDDDLVGQVQSILDQDAREIGPVTQWNQALEALLKAKVAYVVEDVHPSLLLVHPENRSKLGVNAFNAHRIGAYIKRVGADLQELKKATAFELCPVDPHKSRQLEFNKNLVARSAGMLASLSGGERYLTVGCGHTGQVCKAIDAGCKTPQPTLADASGHMNSQALTKDDRQLHTMVNKGWAWTVLPWQCELTWPKLPNLAQRALNASNSVASQSSELETACTIAEFAQMHEEPNWEQCVEAARAAMPACSGYIHIIGKYVRLYGGGEGAPMIKYLDSFAKVFGESRRLGEDFLTAVTEAQFPSLVNRYPHLRTGILATNLVSPKMTDGIAKLLVKADVDRLRSRERIQKVDASEATMGHGWEAVCKLMDSSTLGSDSAYAVVGRLHTRTILFITGKAKSGPEARVFESFSESSKNSLLICAKCCRRDSRLRAHGLVEQRIQVRQVPLLMPSLLILARRRLSR